MRSLYCMLITLLQPLVVVETTSSEFPTMTGNYTSRGILSSSLLISAIFARSQWLNRSGLNQKLNLIKRHRTVCAVLPLFRFLVGRERIHDLPNGPTICDSLDPTNLCDFIDLELHWTNWRQLPAYFLFPNFPNFPPISNTTSFLALFLLESSRLK